MLCLMRLIFSTYLPGYTKIESPWIDTSTADWIVVYCCVPSRDTVRVVHITNAGSIESRRISRFFKSTPYYMLLRAGEPALSNLVLFHQKHLVNQSAFRSGHSVEIYS